MQLADAINAAFEASGGIMNCVNCLQLYRDKRVSGVSITAQMFFAGWGFWNLFYYPHLGQWFSFAGGLPIVLANVAWVVMALYYGKARD